MRIRGCDDSDDSEDSFRARKAGYIKFPLLPRGMWVINMDVPLGVSRGG